MVRAKGTRVALENTGDLVFLYDEASEGAIRSAYPAFANGHSWDPVAREARQLAHEGALVAFEVGEPTTVEAEFGRAAGLSAAERARAAWLRPQTARIVLPTGKLRVETLDSLRLTDEPIEDEGTVLEVPPGAYTLTLERLDRAAMPDGGAGFPDEVILLWPEVGPSAAMPAEALLRYPVARPRWGAWSVQDGVATGEVAWAMVGAGTNLDAGAIARLGLRPGMRLEATIGPQTHRAVYLGNLDQQAWRELVGPAALDAAAAREPDLARAYMHLNPGPAGEPLPALAFHDFTGVPRPWAALELGMRVSVRALPDPVFPAPDDAWTAMWQVADGGLKIEVVGCGADDLVLGAPPEALAKLGAAPGGPMTLELGGETRKLWWVAEERLAGLLREQAGAGVLVGWLMPHWELGDRRVLRVRALAGGETGITVPVGSTAVLRT
jgi:hypothetical protein